MSLLDVLVVMVSARYAAAGDRAICWVANMILLHDCTDHFHFLTWRIPERLPEEGGDVGTRRYARSIVGDKEKVCAV